MGHFSTRAIAFGLFLLLWPQSISAEVDEYFLTVEEQIVNFSGTEVPALTVNGTIPAPTIEWTEGNVARVHVTNKLKVETSIHWHGILLPNRQDGVSYLTTPPILPGSTHTFEFPVIHSGTYWYHSHTGLQEQKGVYGAIVIHPKTKAIQSDRDYTVVLSDWTDEDPKEVLRTLKSGSHYYALKKGAMQSLLGAWQAGGLADTFHRELMRMPPMDISDVAYDAFLMNGARETKFEASAGDLIRLRIVNAGASTYFYLQFAGGPMQIISADGVNVEPVTTERLLIAVAETYDLLIKVPEQGSFEFRATAQDGSGFASGFLGSGVKKPAPDVPDPNLYKMHGHGQHQMMSEDSHMHQHDSERPSAPYDQLKARAPTALSDERTFREYTFELSGDMERYVWMMNGKTLTEADYIKVRRGENVRFKLVNTTMMHHPMHLHGHFFRVLNAHGRYSPLMHTVDVPPLESRTIEFAADKDKDWFFHCHILYHMKAGMSRIVRYQDSKMDPDIASMRDKLFMNPWYPWAKANFLSQMSDGEINLANTRNTLSVEWEAEWGEDYEVTPYYSRYFNRFFSLFAGANLESGHNRGVFGFDYLLPLMLHTRHWVDTEGEFRFSAERHIQLSERISIFGEAEYDTAELWEGVAGADYVLGKHLSLVGQWHSEFGAGGGIQIKY